MAKTKFSLKLATWVWVVGILVILALIFVGYYNRFVGLDQNVKNKWAQVEVQYQRRFDLIPNLVSSVKGILKQEQTVFGDIAEARTRYSGSGNVNDKVAAANNLESALSRLLVIVENYPELKSSQNIADLMAELSGTENRVSVERKRYNDAVTSYNNATKRIPGVIFARILGFGEKTLFEAVGGAEKAPKVELTQ